MKEQDKNKAWGFTLFLDDVRPEVGGKMSLMGLYQADMLFPGNMTFPATVPKLCLFVMYYEKADAVADDVQFKVTFGSEQKPIVEFTIPRKDLGGARDESSPADLTTEDKERILHSRIPILLSPWVLPGPGRLRVRAHYADGSVLKLGSLAIRTLPPDEFNKALALSPIAPPV